MTRSHGWVVPSLAVLGGLLAVNSAHAAEGGTTHYQPGALATLIDLPPTEPGWVVEPVYMHYRGDASEDLPLAGEVVASLELEQRRRGRLLTQRIPRCGRAGLQPSKENDPHRRPTAWL